MSNKAKAIPDGYHVITPYITVKNVPEAIAFYTKVFGAKERVSVPGFNGKVGHAEILIGDHAIMLTDEFPYLEALSPHTLGGTTMGIHLYVEDVDAVYNRALEAGCRIVFAIEDQFCGNRSAAIADPFGHNWYIATHTEDMTYEEMCRRGADAVKAAEVLNK